MFKFKSWYDKHKEELKRMRYNNGMNCSTCRDAESFSCQGMVCDWYPNNETIRKIEEYLINNLCDQTKLEKENCLYCNENKIEINIKTNNQPIKLCYDCFKNIMIKVTRH